MVWVFRNSISINIFQVCVPYRVKEPGFLGGKQRKLKQKAVFLLFCSRKQMVLTFPTCSRYRVKELRWPTALFATIKGVLERWYILLRKHGDRIP